LFLLSEASFQDAMRSDLGLEPPRASALMKASRFIRRHAILLIFLLVTISAVVPDFVRETVEGVRDAGRYLWDHRPNWRYILGR
jgi:hypothetical protein